MDNLQRTILVTGATGYIGGRLITALEEKGFAVRAMARSPGKLAHRAVEVVRGDVFEPESLDGALAGVETAYYLIHSLGGEDFVARDLLGAQNFAEACERQGVKRIIYLGGLGEQNAELSSHLRSRQQTGDALRSTSVPVTELRAAIIVGSGSASFEIIRDLVAKLPVMVCPKWVKTRCEPISVRQVLAYLVGCLDEPRTVGETLEIGGGTIYTYREMLLAAAEVMGRPVYIIDVPVLTPRLSSYWLHLVTSVPFSIAKPLVDGLKNDVVCSDHRIRDWIMVPDVSYSEAVRLALDSDREGRRETRWTDATNELFVQHLPGKNQKPLMDEQVLMTSASPRAVFTIVQRIGGETGWYYGTWLWELRGLMDLVIGGVGMRRGRRDPKLLRVGDPLDFWRVEEWEPGRRLVLKAEMLLPGVARLEFNATPREDQPGSFLVQTARFWPSGWLGALYWYATAPLHVFIFPGMAQAIVRRAEALTRRRSKRPKPVQNELA